MICLFTRYPQDGHAEKDSSKVWFNAPVYSISTTDAEGNLICSHFMTLTLWFQKKQSAELSRIMGELRVDGASSRDYDDDLLDLMDSANWS